MQAAFARAGITSAEELRVLGADGGYARLIGAGERPHFMAYIAVVAALDGRPWGSVTAAEKAALRARYDRLRADAAPTDLERELDALGVRPRPAPDQM